MENDNDQTDIKKKLFINSSVLSYVLFSRMIHVENESCYYYKYFML